MWQRRLRGKRSWKKEKSRLNHSVGSKGRALSKADAVLEEIEQKAKGEYLPILGPLRGRALVKVVRETRPKRILEVGTLIGYSTILMGKELGTDACIITVENYADWARIAERNIRRAEILPTVKVLFGDAAEVLRRLDGEFDLVFLDADKRENLEYLLSVEDKIHKGSVIVADNAGIFASLMRDYLDYVRFSGKYRSSYRAVGGDGLEVSVRL